MAAAKYSVNTDNPLGIFLTKQGLMNYKITVNQGLSNNLPSTSSPSTLLPSTCSPTNFLPRLHFPR